MWRTRTPRQGARRACRQVHISRENLDRAHGEAEAEGGVTGAPAIDRLRTVCDEIRANTQNRPRRGVRHDDADGDVGTFASDDAIGFDPFPMLAVMQATGSNYAVFGQV